MDSIDDFYRYHLDQSPDIRGHLGYIRNLAATCSHVTEFGVRWGSSTSALIHSGARYRGYDITETFQAQCLINAALSENRDVRYIISSSLDAFDMEDTDLLLIDSLHTYAHALAELNMHHHRVSKYIILHDTVTFGMVGEDGGPGLCQAVNEFLESNPEWQILEHFQHDNGLTVLAKRLP